jgi:hypothetical protein
MIEFIGTSITIFLNYNQLQQLTIGDCQDSLHSFLDYERLLFHCDWLGSDLLVGHFFRFRCPLVNTPRLNTQLSYEWFMTTSRLRMSDSRINYVSSFYTSVRTE